MTAGRERSGRSLPRSGRCLVLALDGLGDMVLRQPLLSGLADAGYDVHVLLQAGYVPLLRFLDERLPGIPAPLEWERAPALPALRTLLRRLRDLDPALVVSAQYNPVTYVDWIVRALPGAFAAGFGGGVWQEVAGARRLEPELGLPQARPFDLVVTCEELTAESDKARRFLAAVTGRTPASVRPHLIVAPSDRQRASEILRSLGLAEGGFAACHPAGTKNVTIKAWPPERYGRIAAWLARERSLPTLVMGHTTEAVVVKAVETEARAAGATVHCWLGGENDLDTMVGLLATARLYIGNDTGPMHLAAAAGLPVVAVFGGGHWPRFLPVAQRGAVHTRKLPCFGCGWRDCFFGDGPCVGRVEEEAVRASVRRLLDGDVGFEVHDDALPLRDADWARAVTTFRELSSRAAALRGQRSELPICEKGDTFWARTRRALRAGRSRRRDTSGS